MARWKIAVLVLVAACGGGDGLGLSPVDRLAVATADTGAIEVVNVPSGVGIAITEDGPYGALVFSSDGRRLAFARESQVALNRTVFAADIASGRVRQLSTTTGSFAPAMTWLESGWLTYPVDIGGSTFRTALVGPDDTDGRILGTDNFVRIDESRRDGSIAYLDCIRQATGVCSHDLVIEEPDGSNHRVLASGISGNAVRFVPDGTAVVYPTLVADEWRLMRQSIGGGAPTDLGPIAPFNSLPYDVLSGGLRFSPDGREIAVERSDSLVAVQLDGSAERVLSDQPVHRAFYTAAGDAIFELEIDTEVPPDDTPQYEYSSFSVSPSGEVTELRQGDPSCQLELVSSSGELVAYTCPTGPVHRIDGSMVIETGGYFPIGFTSDEQAVVVADIGALEIRYVPIDGGPSLVVAEFSFEPGQSGPQYAFR